MAGNVNNDDFDLDETTPTLLLKFEKTSRGFPRVQFKDRYGSECSIQESSLATEAAIWFGPDEAGPKIMASEARRLGIDTGGDTTGWVEYPVPKGVMLTTRMHLTRDQVGVLLPVLQRFAETGELSSGGAENLVSSLREKELAELKRLLDKYGPSPAPV